MRNDHQNAFIKTVRQALDKPQDGGPAPALFNRPPDDMDGRLTSYRERSALQQKALLDELTTRAKAVNMGVSVVPETSAAADAVRELVHRKTPEWGSAKRLVTWDHPLITDLRLEDRLAEDRVPVAVTRLTDGQDTEAERLRLRHAVEDAYIGVTSADFVVAHTATMVMRSRPGELRSVSLVPSIHICVLYTEQILADLGELYTRLQWDPEERGVGLTNCMTFISAPSKTGDIELVMVNGAHGPREVHLIIISK